MKCTAQCQMAKDGEVVGSAGRDATLWTLGGFQRDEAERGHTCRRRQIDHFNVKVSGATGPA